jgi:membrane associated rhomboid family serine protease
MLLINTQSAGPKTDNMGHLGGLITGGLMGLVFATGQNEKQYRNTGIIIVLIYESVLLSVFYTLI